MATDLMHSSSCSARRRSCSSCSVIIDLLAVVWLLDEEAEVAGVLNASLRDDTPNFR